MPSTLTRRAAVAAAAASLASTAGCSLLDSGPGRTVFDESLELAAGDYHSVEFSLDAERSVAFGFDHRDGPGLDVFFLSADELAAYRDGGEFAYRHASALGVEGGRSEDNSVPPGEYAVVFDNTERGEAAPGGRTVSGNASVDVQPSN